MKNMLFSLLALLSLAGCATDPATDTDMNAEADREERVVVTGSIIPRRVRDTEVKTVSPEAMGRVISTATPGTAPGN